MGSNMCSLIRLVAARIRLQQWVPWPAHDNSRTETGTESLSWLPQELSYLTLSSSYQTVTE